ncbi:MAG: helix-turn-helix domain-containing protein [bacterium]
MANQTLIDYIIHGREERNLEYKESIDWNTFENKERIIKACLAMANLQDGGIIVLGMKEVSKDVWEPQGMTSDHFDTYSQDDVSEKVNEYADPSIQIKLSKIQHDNKNFIVIEVAEFREIPIICRKTGTTLKKGGIYIRPKSKNESVIVPNESELREILDKAVEIKLEKLRIRCSMIAETKEVDKLSKEKYNDEVKDLL